MADETSAEAQVEVAKRLGAEWQGVLSAIDKRAAEMGFPARSALDSMLTTAIANKCAVEGKAVVIAHLREIADFYEQAPECTTQIRH